MIRTVVSGISIVEDFQALVVQQDASTLGGVS